MKRNGSLHTGWFVVIALALAPLEGTWLYLQRHWDEIPAYFPTHWNIHGIANAWAVRTEATVARPLVIGAAIIAIIFLTAAFTHLAEADDHRLATRMIFPILAVISWSLSALFSWMAIMPLGHTFGPAGIPGVAVAQAAITIGCVTWVASRMKQATAMGMHAGTPGDTWRAGGLLYYNPSDDSVFVPKRIGWGWTLNFARPAAWWYLAVVMMLTVGMGLIPFFLKA